MIKYLAYICICLTISVAGFVRLSDTYNVTKSSLNSLEISDDFEELSKAIKNYFGVQIDLLENSQALKVFQVKNISQSEVTAIVQRSKEIENLKLHSLTLTPADISLRYNVKIVYAAQ